MTDLRMSLHNRKFFVGVFTGLVEDFIGDTDFTYVM